MVDYHGMDFSDEVFYALPVIADDARAFLADWSNDKIEQVGQAIQRLSGEADSGVFVLELLSGVRQLPDELSGIQLEGLAAVIVLRHCVLVSLLPAEQMADRVHHFTVAMYMIGEARSYRLRQVGSAESLSWVAKITKAKNHRQAEKAQKGRKSQYQEQNQIVQQALNEMPNKKKEAAKIAHKRMQEVQKTRPRFEVLTEGSISKKLQRMNPEKV